MNLETELDIQHKLRRVAFDNSVAEFCLAYFKRFPENETWFITELNELYWRNKYIGQYRNHISLTAIPLANKIYEQLGIITFPFIHRVTCRGWDTAGGTWAWSMQAVGRGQYSGDIGSCDPVKYLLKKNIKLYELEGANSNGEIGGEEKRIVNCPK